MQHELEPATVKVVQPDDLTVAAIAKCTCGEVLTAVSHSEAAARTILRRKHRKHVANLPSEPEAVRIVREAFYPETMTPSAFAAAFTQRGH